MSEKATLLTSIPPVQKEVSNDDASSNAPTLSLAPSNANSSSATSSGGSSLLLSSAPEQSKADNKKTEGKVSLLSQAKVDEPKPKSTTTPELTVSEKPEPVLLNNVQPAKVETAQTSTQSNQTAVATAGVVEEADSITAFQIVTYASFVMNFLLAGAAAVILFKKASKLAEERFAISTKVLAIAAVLIMLHGFFATYMYAVHLKDALSSAPLFTTMAIWVLVGPAVGYITRNLLARSDKPNRKAAYVDAVIYGVIFFLTAVSLSSGITTNGALLFSIFAGFLMIVPIARSLTAFKVAKARHQELKENSDQILIYGLLLLPALLPILAFAHVCGLSDAVTLFLINFITFDFVLVVGLAMMASADELIPEQAAEDATVQTKASAKAPDPPAPLAPPTQAPSKLGAAPAEMGNSDSEDPIIQFLRSEEGMAEKNKSQAAAKSTPRSAPVRKPGRPGMKPPVKPGSASSDKAPNAPSRIKVPAKPKKRF